MLVITRKIGEGVKIGDDIRVVIVHIDHNRVKIGIEAPKDVPIWREELRATNGGPRDGGEGESSAD